MSTTKHQVNESANAGTDQGTTPVDPALLNQWRGTISAIEAERTRISSQRLRQILLIGLMVSVVVHLSIAIYLSGVFRGGGQAGSPEAAPLEFALMLDEELTELESIHFDDLSAEEALIETEFVEEESSALEPDAAAADLEIKDVGAMPALDGAGGDDGQAPGLSGSGSGATSFFGVSSEGTRFCYIVDVSGSMEGARINTALRELARSIQQLPDFAYFYIVFYSSSAMVPPMQDGWVRARKRTVNQYVRWFSQIGPGGGTQPLPAFQRAFALETRPDVIFFLTDGEIPAGSADAVSDLNSRGRRVMVHTIAFGKDASQAQLRQIAIDSGGTHRDVQVGAN